MSDIKKHVWPRYDQAGRTSPGDKAIASLIGIEITGNSVRHIARFRNGAGPIDSNFIDFYSSIADGILRHEWAMGGETKTFVRFVPEHIEGYSCEFRITPDTGQQDKAASALLDDYTGLPDIKEITPEMEAADRAAINKWLVSCITSAPSDSGLHTMTALEIKAIAMNFLINTRKDVVVGPTEENSLSRWY